VADASLGTVAELWRYPVKSMLGERIEAAEVTRRGLPLITLRSSGNRTRLAGRLMPAEMVSVDTTNLRRRARVSSSTSCL